MNAAHRQAPAAPGLPESPLFIAPALRPGAINLFNDRVSTYSMSFCHYRRTVNKTKKQRRSLGDGRLMRRFVSIVPVKRIFGRTITSYV